MEAIAKIGRYVLKKNELKAKRQRARAKVGYYEKLFNYHGKELDVWQKIRGWKKWNKPGKKQHLRLLIKKWRIEQLKAEIEIHELVIAARKDLNKIRKEMAFNLPFNTNKIVGIYVKQFGHASDRTIYLNEIEKIVLDQEAEDILLRGVV
jgi:hypothetical protein